MNRAERVNILDTNAVSRLLASCDGIIHLAAVSRVVEAQRNPVACWRTNVEGTESLLKSIRRVTNRPWIIYGSSREVYGPGDGAPVIESAPYDPINVYARAKVAAEELLQTWRLQGGQAVVLRFSNVYGAISDHANRVIPAFVRAAMHGGVLRVEGASNSFDFTHLRDVVRGISTVVEALEQGEMGMPPIHLTTGKSTSLLKLASMAIGLGSTGARVQMALPRSFDVHHFCGNPERARQLLGWQAEVDLAAGLAELASDFARADVLSGNGTHRACSLPAAPWALVSAENYG